MRDDSGGAPWLELPNCMVAADLHLDGGDEGRSRFREMLEVAAESTSDLLILGDLFHYWFGRKHLKLPMFAEEVALLRQATAAGLKIRIVPGNRDFLLDSAFERATGVEIHHDLLIARVAGSPVHFSHGDLFGTSDVRYQRMRRVLHSKMVLFLANHLPAFVLDRLAGRLRQHSARVVQQKSAATLEPDLEAVATLFRDGFETVVCGHFHRERDQRFAPDAGGGRFMILEPFEDRGAVLVHDGTIWSPRLMHEGDRL